MSDSPPSDGDEITPSVTDYTDFYDLLGVTRSDDSQEIMNKSRKLLGKYHPDVSDHPDADQVFKSINRAQSVLTDDEQRTIYDKIGHEQYVEKREEGGEMTLSENVTASGDFDDSSGSGTADGDTESDVSVDYGSSGRNKRNTSSGDGNSHSSYQSIVDFDLDLRPEEAMSQLYRQIWLLRLVTVFSLGASVIYFWFGNPESMANMANDFGVPNSYGLGAVTIMAFTLAAVVCTILTGLYCRYYMQTVEEDISLGEDSSNETPDSNSDATAGGRSNQDEGDSTNSSWDVQSRYDATRSEKDTASVKEERRNRSLSFGAQSLLMTIGALLFGSQVSGGHPWTYLELILDGEGVDATLWWNFGGESVRELAILLNAGGSLIVFLFAVFGVALTAHGLSREVWHRRYFTRLNVSPVLWDTGIIATITAFASGLVLSRVNISNATIESLPDYAVSYLAANGGVSSLSVAILSLTFLYGLYLLFLLRAKYT